MAISTREQAAKIRINKTNVEKLTATDGRAIFWDDSITGFGVRVMPSGTKTYFFQGRVGRELIRITIGKHPAVTPEQARKLAKIHAGNIATGKDPRPERQTAANATFGDLMTAYADLLESQGKKDARPVRLQIIRNIQKAHPRIWKKPVSTIDLDDCMVIVGKLRDEGKPRQADKIRSYIRTAFSEAINARGDVNMPATMRRLDIKYNPARDMRKVKGSSGAKDRALSLAEFQAYWRRIKELQEPARSLTMLHVLTGGQRQQQLARATLNDIDRDAPSLSILDYKGRRSKPRLHVLPLLPEALEAIDAITGGGEFVFSCDGGLTPIHNAYLNDQIKKVRAAMEAAGELEKGPFTAGSIRATIETRLAAKPYRVGSDVLAHLLSHGMGGIQARHYQHHNFFDEKLEALEKLHRMLEGQAEPVAEIIPMRRATA
ncbi:tyrosine-type recombinase/integrase [Desulfurivibrio alkaliphilus]|uniref:Integrase family protein n=1 Tax=Desulfurivibrio alkaliphilus (strain DSM 19089 / UNIQEM U267 / AHT2) TaxID=589865 RepID=D6Z326_DESAT|nr:integrase family protein [Desulfurivibrio alkaliphilus]ADH85951.1 integrase family protein [Desulfurivibrio alkaliphilus AHT 2]